jgi:hypothetical protein
MSLVQYNKDFASKTCVTEWQKIILPRSSMIIVRYMAYAEKILDIYNLL